MGTTRDEAVDIGQLEAGFNHAQDVLNTQVVPDDNLDPIKVDRDIDMDGNTILNLPGGIGGGEKGDTGEQGPQGIQGEVGPQGPTGATGPKGDTGDAGPKGDKGDTGDPGADSTVAGPEGPAGPKGDKGDPGVDGSDGADSTVPGPTGATGATGAKGDQGDPGADGSDGAPGADSTVPGPQGPQGPQGEPGATGATGAQGIPGNDGADGSDATVNTANVAAAGAIMDTDDISPGSPGWVNPHCWRVSRTSTQSIPNVTSTKLELNSIRLNPSGNFNASTNRFTATVAGYYQVGACLRYESLSSGTDTYVYIRVNGSNVASGMTEMGGIGESAVQVDDLIELGVGDYVEIWVYHNNGNTRTTKAGASWTYSWGSLVHAT